VACWSTKAAISLKRVKIEEKLPWRAYELINALSNGTISDRHTASSSPRLGFPPKTSIAIISRRVKLWTANLAGKFIRSIRTQAHEKFGRKGSVGVSRNCPIFWIALIVLRTGQPTNFTFSTHIHRIDRNKSPLKISHKVAVGLLSDSQKCLGHSYIRRIARSSLR